MDYTLQFIEEAILDPSSAARLAKVINSHVCCLANIASAMEELAIVFNTLSPSGTLNWIRENK